MNHVFNRTRFERDFPSLTQVVYLNSAGQGPKPSCVIDKITRYYEKTLLYGACVRPLLSDIIQQVDETREKTAAFFGVETNEVAFIRCIAEGINTLLDGIDLKAGDEVITSWEENPALLIPLYSFLKEKGIILKKIELPNNKEEILKNLDMALTEKTKLVVMSHVTHTRGLCIPAKEIADRCHERGAWFALDGAQAAGQIGVNIKKIGCDYYLAAGYKWLLGVHGTTIAIMGASLLANFHLKYGGVGSQQRFNFETDEFCWKEDASQLEYGSRHWPLYLGLSDALDYLDDLGIKNIQDHVSGLRKILKSGMERLGFNCESPEDESLSSGIVTFSKRDMNFEQLVVWLYEKRNILVQFRSFSKYSISPKGLRISLSFFTTEDEVKQLIKSIDDYQHLEEKRGEFYE